MKETRFIKENKKKWERFEKLSRQENYDADELSKLYIEITDDLSYAQSKYPKRAVRVYLNQLAQNIFNSVYKKKKKKFHFWKFWKKTLPLELFSARKNLLASLLIFLVAMLIGIVSQEYDHGFARIILSDYYVEMTEENIALNDPLAVYDSSGGTYSFLTITQNNIRVAFFTFVLGIFFSVGTYYILLINGIMVGAFQWFFKTKGLLLASFLGIWIHGAFEICSIVIAGAAGITMGNGLLFPGTMTRLQSLIISAKRGLRIMLGLMPFIILAGFLESFVTRHYKEISDLGKWMIILFSFGTMLFYFGVYPFIAYRKWGKSRQWAEKPTKALEKEIRWDKIKSITEIVTDGFFYFRKNLLKFLHFVWLPVTLLLTLNVVMTYFHYALYLNYDLYWFEIFQIAFGTGEFFNVYSFLVFGLVFSLVAHGVLHSFRQPYSGRFKSFWKDFSTKIFVLYPVVLIIMSVFWFLPIEFLLLFIFLLPFLLYTIPAAYFEKGNPISKLLNGFTKGGILWGNNFGLIWVIFIIAVFFFQILAGFQFGFSPDAYKFPDILDALIIPIIEMHTSSLFQDYWIIISLVRILFYFSFLILFLPFLFVCMGMGYFSVNEHQTSEELAASFEKFGKRSKSWEDFS